MIKHPRTQTDGKQDEFNKLTAITFPTTPDEDRARQEFRAETDVNKILKNFGVGHLNNAAAPYGEHDYTIDLQQALTSVEATRRAYDRLPEDVREKYPTWQRLVEAMENGTYESPADERKRLDAEEQANAEARAAEIRAELAKLEKAREENVLKK